MNDIIDAAKNNDSKLMKQLLEAGTDPISANLRKLRISNNYTKLLSNMERSCVNGCKLG